MPLVLDASWFNPETWKEVSRFLNLPLKAKVVRRFPIASRALRKFTGRHWKEFTSTPAFTEPLDDQSFDPAIAEAPPDCFLSGFFQSPLYFRDTGDTIREELNGLFDRKAEAGDTLGERLLKRGTVAVHVRRGDYLWHPQLHVCDRGYYDRAMERMRELVPDARFLVFSDDPAWCRDEFRSDDIEVVETREYSADPLRDLRLMSLAGSHIIANSSYSWWAAWLGKKPGQNVIMPSRWFAGGIVAPIEEKKCEDWIVLES